ncbi:MAG: T9SS type A sorting domain-containing protein, partial [Flavobacterium sp.]
YCSFTPGGDYNTITGALTFDFNANGCDASDLPHPFIKININDGTNSGATFTSSVGNYDFYTQAGTFVVTPEFENDWFTASPASANVVFPVVDNSVETENFCITANGVHKDIEVVMVPVVPARPGFDAVYKIVYKNKGNQVVSGSVSCQWDYAILDAVEFTPTPTTLGVGNYSWAYSNLMPFENREILMTLNVNAPTDNPAVNIDDILSFTAAGLVSGDETPGNNTYVLDQAVVGSFDPNNIICIEGETAPAAAIGDYLHYVVNFENTGNGAAEFVVVRHDIDITKFDIASLQVLNSSHEAVARVNGNRVEFIFSGINLAPLDHGNILFKLKSKSTLEAGDSVMNRANIYFDYNFPIETNEANTVFEVLSTSDFEKDNSVTVYPNPSKGFVIIKSENNVRSVQVFDIQGRLLQTVIANETDITLDMTSQQSGIYFIKIKTDKGVKVEKLIKE